MAQKNVVVMDVNVKQLTKFGFQNEKDAYVGWGQYLKDAEKSQVVPGRTFSVEMYIAESGKMYVNKILKQLDKGSFGNTVTNVPPLVAPVFAKTPTVKPLAKAVASETMSKGEWAEKDTRISRQGVIQAAVQAIANLGMADSETLFPLAEALANQMLAFVNQK